MAMRDPSDEPAPGPSLPPILGTDPKPWMTPEQIRPRSIRLTTFTKSNLRYVVQTNCSCELPALRQPDQAGLVIAR
jgi:hypothetical protein